MQFVDLAAQYSAYKDDVDAGLRRVLEHGKYIMGPEVYELEEKLAAYVGVKRCITVSSGTMSLEIALRALGVGPGDEVITTPFTWISTAEVILLVGAKPVFVDIDAATYNIDVDRVSEALSERTRAIIPVSLFGQMPRLEAIHALAEARGIAVIEDAAQSFGATRHGQRSGGVTSIGSTSFFPAKPFGCYGDGGALFTNDEGLAEDMTAIRNHGGIQRHDHRLVGTNGRFDTLQAAVLLAKLPHLDGELAAREAIGAMYSKALADSCVVPEVLDGNSHVYGQYTVRVKERDKVGQLLKAAGVPTAVYYPKCLHEQPVFGGLGCASGDFPEAERASREVLSLPMHPFLSPEAQERVVDAFREASARLAS